MSTILEYLIGLITIIFIVVIIYFLIPILVKYYLRKRFIKKIRKSGNVYLTFDDGPNPHSTIEVLNILKVNNIRATFFLTGKNTAQYPFVVDKIIQLGHSIGEHSYEHTHAWYSGPFKTAKDLLNGKRIMEKYLDGNQKMLFRPPFGKMNLVTILYVLLYRRKIVFWDIDPKDFLKKDKDEIANYVLSGLNSGRVVLLHDNSPNFVEMISALKIIIEKVKGSNMKFATISEVN